MFRFEKLDVWHKAIELSDEVYSITRSFPDGERFGFTSQMRRSAVSVANIAEGSGRHSTRQRIEESSRMLSRLRASLLKGNY